MKIVLDPGHGGEDFGAVSVDLNFRESDINLAVVLAVMALGGVDLKFYATRLVDEYLTLRERCDFANDMGADLFVSVHSNSCGDPSVRGFEDFYYRGSSEGLALARSLGFELEDAWYEIIGDDAIFRGVKTADFYVLKHTNMPAVLVELGFISNDEEAKLLATVAVQRRLADAIIEGVKG